MLELSDPNPVDALHVRMFVDYDRGNFQIVRTLTSPGGGTSRARAPLEFADLHCSDLGLAEAGAGGAGGAPARHLLELVVSDRDFDDAGGLPPINRHGSSDGFVVAATWMFVCT